MLRKIVLTAALLTVVAFAQSPAELAIEQAQSGITKSPDARGYSTLAMAYARRARETAEVVYYQKAHEALDKSLELDPGNYAARRLRPWLLLGQHEFAAALTAARALNKEYPDDIIVSGMLTDANVELGKYSDAVEAAQWMLDMRPGNVPGLTRAAYLRELHGEEEGSLELLAQALRRVRGSETEERAWILCQMSHVERNRGNADTALQYAEQALEVFSGYHYALGEQARALVALGRNAEAVTALKARYASAPHPENLYELAAALQMAGQSEEAQAAFAEFEKAGLAESANTDNANHELVALYVDQWGRPEDGLRVAKMEFERRQDVFTRGALAWALHSDGKSDEAWQHTQMILDQGARSAEICYHAGAVAMAVGETERGEALLAEALKRAPSPDVRERVQALHGARTEASE